MANDPYNSGVPSVTPDVHMPDDYQHIDARPEAFGALIGQGLQQFGQGAVKASQFYGQIAADDGTNQLANIWNKRLYGDPAKTVAGPDGKMVPDTGYFGLKGADMLRARPQLAADMDKDLKDIRATLTTPESQLQFDQYSRRMRQSHDQMVGHAGEVAMTQYGQQTSHSSAEIAKNDIAINALDDEKFNHGLADLRTAYLKQNDLAGGGELGAKAATQRAAQEAWLTRIETVRVKDPSAASEMAEAHKAELGDTYPKIAETLKRQGEVASGGGAGAIAFKAQPATPAAPAHPDAPKFAEIGGRYGVSGDYLARTRQIESGPNPNATSPTGAQGPFQFIPSTWKQFGHGSPFDMAAATDAAARLAASNKSQLAHSLGREPSDAELYLAHQQGAGGAATLLANPNATPASLGLGNAVAVNGGNPNAPASAFTSMWAAKFAGLKPQAMAASGYGGQGFQMPAGRSTVGQSQLPPVDPYVAPPPSQPAIPPAPPSIEDRLADIQQRQSQALLSMPEGKSPEWQAAFRSEVESHAQAEILGLKAEETRQTAAHNHVMADYQTRLDKGDMGSKLGLKSIWDDINNDTRLTGFHGEAVKDALRGYVTKRTGDEDPIGYGPEYSRVIKGISAKPGDPDRITSPIQLMQMYNEGRLTHNGMERAGKQLDLVKAGNTADAHLNASLTSVIDGFKKRLSFDDEQLYPGMPPIKYPAGEFAFHSQFVPRILGEYDKWVADRKNPWDFIKDTNHFAEVAEQILPAKKVAMDKLAAGAALAGEAPPGNSTQKPAIPPPPQNVDPGNWQQVMDERPSTASGKKWDAGRWATYLDAVKANPTKENLEEFKAKTGLEPESVFKKIEPDNRSLFEKARDAGRSIGHVLKGD